ncbi:hypothetical protein [Ectopseudomonas khazarica]|uniref:hypothetical protein n=1 Tax=Ectopseudomonas khazarica TaxID=2502979 RepID=UPI002FE1F7F2
MLEKKLRILLISEKPATARGLEHALNRLGYFRVTAIDSLVDALPLADSIKRRFDLILIAPHIRRNGKARQLEQALNSNRLPGNPAVEGPPIVSFVSIITGIRELQCLISRCQPAYED